MRFRPAALAACVACGATPLAAQVRTMVRISPIYESYSFDAGLPFTAVSEFTIPVGMDIQLGRLGALALSTGFANVRLTSADPVQLPDQSVSGILDTELRYSYNLVPGKLVFIANGALPTGVKTVEQEQLSILGALSSDVIGFAASSLGSGGNVGGGLVGAIPVGTWAVGLGATYKLPLSYTPVVGRTDALKPGAEVRLRTGLEGPLGRTTYFRFAGIYARTNKDAVGASTQNGVGNRLIGYGSLNHGFGETQATLYAFDVLRGDPQLEATAAGAAILPRGNLLAVGLRVAYPLGPGLTVSPNIEVRNSAAADSAGPGPLQRLGHSLRLGADLRRDTGNIAGEVRLGYTSGYVVTGGAPVNLSGLRLALQVELHP
jgi:hypothetical protein